MKYKNPEQQHLLLVHYTNTYTYINLYFIDMKKEIFTKTR